MRPLRLLSFVILGGLSAGSLPLQAQPMGKRYAVLIGVNDYEHAKLSILSYAERDVTELARVLESAGYEVALLTGASGKSAADLQPTRANFQNKLAETLKRCKRHDTVLVALAGHGLQFDGDKDSFFCPREANPAPERTDTLISLKSVYDQLDASGAGVKLLLVDACRNDPVAGRGRGIDGLLAPRPPRGVAALFSCSAGERAFESDKLKHGVFFHHVLEGLRGKARDAEGEVTWDSLAAHVRRWTLRDVPQLIGEGAKQTPALNAGELAGEPPVLVPAEMVNRIGMRLVRIPRGTFQMGSPAGEKERGDHEVQHEVEISRDFYLGKFEVTRGQFRKFVEDTKYQTNAETNFGAEGAIVWNPQKEQWGWLKGYSWQNTNAEQTDEHPVVSVSWHDARAFCEWLSKKEGKTYRMPSEAEWEYVYRAGSTTPFPWGDDAAGARKYANLADQTLKKKLPKLIDHLAEHFRLHRLADWEDGYVFTAPVGSFPANAWGVHDLEGNVTEWLEDLWGPYTGLPRKDPLRSEVFEGQDLRARRGACCIHGPSDTRSALRLLGGPAFRSEEMGFRVVYIPEPAK